MIKAVLFDVDGVLVDSFEANREFFARLIGEFGYKAPTREEYKRAFHLNLWDSIKLLSGENDEEKIQKMWEAGRTLPYYPIELLKIPDGLNDVIKELSESYKLGIVTSRIKEGLDEFYDFSGLREYFEISVCFGDYSEPKPSAQSLLLALEKLNIKPGETVYVGDSHTDLIAAEKAGTYFLLYPQDHLKGAKFTAESFIEIPSIIKNIGNHER